MRISTAMPLVVAAFAFPALAISATFNYTGTVVEYTIPTTALYQITAAGAQGGTGSGTVGAEGASLSGNITLTAGTMLDIVVGGMGLTGNFGPWVGGGGGGWVFSVHRRRVDSAPGCRRWRRCRLDNGEPQPNGGAGQITASDQAEHGPGGAGGTGGAGGAGGLNGGAGGGGGGCLGAGTNGAGASGCTGFGSGDGGSGPSTFAGGLGVGMSSP